MTSLEQLTAARAEPGIYRAYPIAWTVEQSTKQGSQSVAIAFQLAIHQKWHGKEQGWSQEFPVGYFTEHRAWVVKSDGEMNTPAIENLAKCGLWDGNWEAIAGPAPRVFVLATVEAETNPANGKVTFRASWLNPDADEPQARGGFAPADQNLLAQMRNRFGSKTRAIAGGQPAGPAPAPPQPTPAGAVAPAPAPAAAPMAAPAGPAPTPARPPMPPGPPSGAPQRAPAPAGAPQQPRPAVAPQQPPQAPPQSGQSWRPPAAPQGSGSVDVDPSGVGPVPF